MNQLMIRIKHEGKCRKATQVPKTIEDLRAKIQEMFGASATKLSINYKDCDGELVSVIDTEDLKNCISEAEAYKMTCVTLLLKEGSKASRSVSSKKKATSESSVAKTESHSESDDNHGFEKIDELETSKAQAEEEAKLIKQKLIEEHQRALAQLEDETQHKIKEIEEKKEMRRGHPGLGKHKGLGMQLPQKVRAIAKFCMGENIENPLVTLKGLFKSLKEEFPALACNPELLNLVIKDCQSSLMTTLKASCQNVIAANPDIAKKGEANKEKFGEIKEEICKNMGQFGQARCHSRRERPERPEGADRDQRKAAKMAEKESRLREKEAMMLAKQAEKQAKQAEKEEMKAKKCAERQAKDNLSEDEKKIRAKVSALKELFPNVHRPQLRAVVVQNLTLTPEELAPMIKASKVSKSFRK